MIDFKINTHTNTPRTKKLEAKKKYKVIKHKMMIRRILNKTRDLMWVDNG